MLFPSLNETQGGSAAPNFPFKQGEVGLFNMHQLKSVKYSSGRQVNQSKNQKRQMMLVDLKRGIAFLSVDFDFLGLGERPICVK